jgi:hypothetical protein
LSILGLNTTFSVVVHFTTIAKVYASLSIDLLSLAVDGKYQGLNGLAVADYFGRNSIGAPMVEA